jgi:hypothetical protein
MIIESGYDLYELALPYLEFGDPECRRLVVISMDADLRYYETDVVADDLGDTIEPHISRIIASLDPEVVHYFAIAHTVRGGLPDADERRSAATQALKVAAAECGFQFINHILIDGDNWIATMGRYRFREYGSLEDLPRATIARGPHADDDELRLGPNLGIAG